jgi:membrane protease subunit HflC
MRRTLIIVGVLVIAVGIVANSALFTVHQAQWALVLQFGNPQLPIREKGLNVKLPFVQNVVYFDRLILDFDSPSEQVTLGDQKRLDVDTFVRYRIVDPLLFYRTINNVQGARQRLAPVVNASLRRSLGNVTLLGVLSEQREKVTTDIRNDVSDEAKRFGIEIVDVRIRRADLPEQAAQAIYARMRSEREREAAEARAQGYEVGQQIRATADRERVVLIAESRKQSEILRGEGEATANRTWAGAFGRDEEFFRFYRSMQAYRHALHDNSTTMVLSPDSEFFRYFGSFGGQKGAAPSGGGGGR